MNSFCCLSFVVEGMLLFLSFCSVCKGKEKNHRNQIRSQARPMTTAFQRRHDPRIRSWHTALSVQRVQRVQRAWLLVGRMARRGLRVSLPGSTVLPKIAGLLAQTNAWSGLEDVENDQVSGEMIIKKCCIHHPARTPCRMDWIGSSDIVLSASVRAVGNQAPSSPVDSQSRSCEMRCDLLRRCIVNVRCRVGEVGGRYISRTGRK